jgi:hypothetical protein
VCGGTCETVVTRNTTELSTLGEKLASGSRDDTHVPAKHPLHPISEHGPAQGGAGSLVVVVEGEEVAVKFKSVLY